MSANLNNNGNGGAGTRGAPLQPGWQLLFCLEYEKTMSITASCRAAGISRPTYYTYLKNDPNFKEMVDEAYEAARDELQRSAFDRAVNGTKQVREFYDQKGNVTSVLETTQQETNLTIKMLEAHIPERYRPVTRQEIGGLDGQPIQIDITEKKRLAVTVMVQKLLDEGFRLSEALSSLAQLGIPRDDLTLVRGSDLKMIEGSDGTYKVESESNGNDPANGSNGAA